MKQASKRRSITTHKVSFALSPTSATTLKKIKLMLLCLLSDCSPRCRFATLPALTSFVVVVLLFATLGHKASIGKREKKRFLLPPLFLVLSAKAAK